MSIKITIPNSSSDVLTFGSGNTPTAAQIAGIDSGSSNGQLALYTTASGTSTERVRVDASGNVGIGVSPSYTLDVYNTSNAITTSRIWNGNSGASSGSQILLGNSANYTNAYFRLNGGGNSAQAGAGSLNIGVTEVAPIAFYTTNTERMRIDSGGFVGIGINPSGTAPLTVGRAASNGNLGQICARGLAAGDAGSAGMSVSKYDATTTTSQIFFKFIIGQGSAGSGQINANGANTAAFGSYSDSRLKENIVDLPSQLDNIMALRPVEYDYIESMGGGHQIGFVAQEVQAIYPDLVGEGSDGMLTLTDMNKNDARLIKAIQEMKAIIDTQASTITSLTDRVSALDERLTALENK